MLLSSQMKEIASNKGEKVQPQVCVAGLSERKFSVNGLQVQENCSHEPISGRGGFRFSDTGGRYRLLSSAEVPNENGRVLLFPASMVPACKPRPLRS